MTADDEFVARAGALWRWIDNAIDAAMRVAIGAWFLLWSLGLPWWLAGPVASALVAVVTQIAVTAERRRLFPPAAS